MRVSIQEHIEVAFSKKIRTRYWCMKVLKICLFRPKALTKKIVLSHLVTKINSKAMKLEILNKKVWLFPNWTCPRKIYWNTLKLRALIDRVKLISQNTKYSKWHATLSSPLSIKKITKQTKLNFKKKRLCSTCKSSSEIRSERSYVIRIKAPISLHQTF